VANNQKLTNVQRKAMFANLNKRLAAQGVHHGKTLKADIAPTSAIIKDPKWQSFRKSLKGTDTDTKLLQLRKWLQQNKDSKESQIQVTNYVNALKRGGQLKP